MLDCLFCTKVTKQKIICDFDKGNVVHPNVFVYGLWSMILGEGSMLLLIFIDLLDTLTTGLDGKLETCPPIPIVNIGNERVKFVIDFGLWML